MKPVPFVPSVLCVLAFGAALAWCTRYHFVVVPGTYARATAYRLNRWTGHTDITTGDKWECITANHWTALDQAALELKALTRDGLPIVAPAVRSFTREQATNFDDLIPKSAAPKH